MAVIVVTTEAVMMVITSEIEKMDNIAATTVAGRITGNQEALTINHVGQQILIRKADSHAQQ